MQQKSNLLHRIPKKYRPHFETITDESYSINPKLEKFLYKDGLVLKPNIGSRSRNTYHLFMKNEKLIVKDLFTLKINNKSMHNNLLDFLGDIKTFKKREGIYSNLILMPYLKHSNILPKNDISIVFRTISEYSMEQDQISIKEAWMEIFDKNNNLNIINHEQYLFNIDRPQMRLEELEKILNFKFKNEELRKIYKLLFSASKAVHSILPPINEVAWDWIKTDNKLYLLEGNSSFSLYPIKYFKILKNRLH
ncbi:hypothetical protein HA152_07610 [Prochlorococcus marinus XMU1412]|uniref:hypothetical protein n=1 Tax=Prochlorococcus marinus TaxID=1219 RepID=UPI001AD961A3|nr:hypothetical protein [Prochlorococcus marinus]MBO8240568.1 hypothetical protein [Prochlorococcus marinus XMU1412]MBW3071802.1 hypothetical protein [Prochlorococcus marinus str. MU1412]